MYIKFFVFKAMPPLFPPFMFRTLPLAYYMQKAASAVCTPDYDGPGRL